VVWIAMLFAHLEEPLWARRIEKEIVSVKRLAV
jgi:hypothetical protein